MHTSITAIHSRHAIAAACAAFLLVACGGGGGSAPTPIPPPVTPPVTTPPPVTVPGAYADPVFYSPAGNASLQAGVEGAAVVSAQMTLAGKSFSYKATTGHLTATDAATGKPVASFFYTAYTAGAQDVAKRPVTFFYNGGPGSASLWLHLGSFGPRRVVTSVPALTMPSPSQMVDNQETLLGHSDLVFVDAIGTGYSAAIAPKTNQDLWGVDADAAAFRDFVMRYVAVNGRQASPKYLFGESYGGPRTGVLANLLEVAGVKLTGIVLQSPAMNYNSNCGVLAPGTVSCEGYIPSYAATSAYHKVATPALSDFTSYMQQARTFSANVYRPAVTAYLAGQTATSPQLIAQLVEYTGLSPLTWSALSLTPEQYRANLMTGVKIGRYDGRIAANQGTPLANGSDPSHTLIDAAFVTNINKYINTELGYTALTSYQISNAIVNQWNFSHDNKLLPDTIPDVAAAMAINPALKVVAMSGYYDLATPFYQTELDMARLGNNPNIIIKNYHGGHMSYLDDNARKAQWADMKALYNNESVAP